MRLGDAGLGAVGPRGERCRAAERAALLNLLLHRKPRARSASHCFLSTQLVLIKQQH